MSLNGSDHMRLVHEIDWAAVRVASAIPGRLRLRSAQLRNDEALADRLREALDAAAAVTDASVNVRTGSVLVHYDDGQLDDLPTLIDRAAAVGVLPEGLDPDALKALVNSHANAPPPRNFNAAAQRFFRSVNESVGGLTGGAIDLTGLAPLTLLGLGARRLLRGGPLEPVPWFTYFWFAFTLFMTFAPDDAEGNAPTPPTPSPAAATTDAPASAVQA
jgi:hypothetical protein